MPASARSTRLMKCALKQASMPTMHGVGFSKTSFETQAPEPSAETDPSVDA
jgi:hypothetical protein